MTEEQQIRNWAAQGWTRQDVAQALGMTLWKLYLQQTAIGLKWPQGRSIGQQRYYRDRRPTGSKERGLAMQAASVAARPHYTVNGVYGTIEYLAEAVGVVSGSSVRRRIAAGMSVEDALLRPAQPGSKRWGEKRDYRFDFRRSADRDPAHQESA